MRNIIRILSIAIPSILACFFAIIIFTQPSHYKFFDLTIGSKNNIANTIDGLTAPVIGIISSILLYFALTKQIESNNDQKIKNESDIIFLLINQLDNEINNFYHKWQEGVVQEFSSNNTVKVIGLEGFNDFCYKWHFAYDYSKHERGNTFKFRYEAGYIILIINSFKLIEERVISLSLSNNFKDIFSQKLNFYYIGKLRIPLNNLVAAFEKFSDQKDEFSDQIVEFVGKQELKQPKSYFQEFLS